MLLAAGSGMWESLVAVRQLRLVALFSCLFELYYLVPGVGWCSVGFCFLFLQLSLVCCHWVQVYHRLDCGPLLC